MVYYLNHMSPMKRSFKMDAGDIKNFFLPNMYVPIVALVVAAVFYFLVYYYPNKFKIDQKDIDKNGRMKFSAKALGMYFALPLVAVWLIGSLVSKYAFPASA